MSDDWLETVSDAKEVDTFLRKKVSTPEVTDSGLNDHLKVALYYQNRVKGINQ